MPPIVPILNQLIPNNLDIGVFVILNGALKAAKLIGNGLYGVDLKQNARGIYVMEINDNPNIDAGVEDQYLGKELYRTIIGEFIRRLEQQRSSGHKELVLE